MRNKKARLGSVLFAFVILLPLLGLMIMDYQLKKANDITGAYLESPVEAYASENLLAGAVVIGAVAFLLVGFIVSKLRKSRLISTMPLARINDEIENIEGRLKNDPGGDDSAS